jgi:hypothetical protein
VTTGLLMRFRTCMARASWVLGRTALARRGHRSGAADSDRRVQRPVPPGPLGGSTRTRWILPFEGGVRLPRRCQRARASAEGYAVDGFLVQRMVGDGDELLVGVVNDASFGPVLACGAGGTAVELLKDVAARITPLTDVDAAEMVRSLATFPLLKGYRGAPKADVAALEDVLLRGERHGRSPPRDRRARLQPGDGPARRRGGRRRQGPGPAPRPEGSPAAGERPAWFS